MTREVQGIPPAPRPARWHKALGYRWPLAALAFSLACYGGVWTWMLFLANGGKAADGRRLDAGPTREAVATVTEVEPSGIIDADTPADRVVFTYDAGGHNAWRNESFAAQGTFTKGDEAVVEYLPGEPHISRLVGWHADLLPDLVEPGLWLVWLVVPGLLAGLAYLIGVMHLRRILVHGDVTVARVLAVERVPLCLPEAWSARFSFRDHSAKEITSRHWVRAHSELGRRLRPLLDGEVEELRMPVLHDRQRPRSCRLVTAEDFAPIPPTGVKESQPTPDAD